MCKDLISEIIPRSHAFVDSVGAFLEYSRQFPCIFKVVGKREWYVLVFSLEHSVPFCDSVLALVRGLSHMTACFGENIYRNSSGDKFSKRNNS